MQPCDLEIQVNEEHTFILHQRLLVSFSGRISKIFSKSSREWNRPRILLHDFPGGAQAFELAAIFCYNGGSISISPSNVSVLRCVAEFLEMTDEFHHGNLVGLTENYLRGLVSWDWDDVLKLMRGCDPVFNLAKKTRIIQRCAEALSWRISSSLEDASPVYSSPDSVHRTNNSGSVSRKSSSSPTSSQRTWWFADISSLPVLLMEKVIKTLVYSDVDNKILARFLTHYLRTSLPVFGYNSTTSTKLRSTEAEEATSLQGRLEKVHLSVLEVGVNLLFRLERGTISCRFLFGLFRIGTVLNASKACRKQLEKMIGVQLHVANLDSILVPLHPPRTASLYDVDLVYRLVAYFFKEQESRCGHEDDSKMSLTPVETPATRVGDLIDSYLAEIAPDVNLKVQKFRRLAEALPPKARWSNDSLYRAVDIYLEAHPDLLDLEVSALCRVIDIQKLSFDACTHISKNPRMPPKFALQVVLFERGKLREALGGCLKGRVSNACIASDTSSCGRLLKSPAKSPSPDFGHSLRTDLGRINLKVAELEKACKNIRTEVSRHNGRVARRLLC